MGFDNSPLTTHRSPLTTHHSLFTSHHSLSESDAIKPYQALVKQFAWFFRFNSGVVGIMPSFQVMQVEGLAGEVIICKNAYIVLLFNKISGLPVIRDHDLCAFFGHADHFIYGQLFPVKKVYPANVKNDVKFIVIKGQVLGAAID